MSDIAEAIQVVEEGEPERVVILEDRPGEQTVGRDEDPFSQPMPATPGSNAERGASVESEAVAASEPLAEAELERLELRFDQEGAAPVLEAFRAQVEGEGNDYATAVQFWRDGCAELDGAADDLAAMLSARALPEVQGELAASLSAFGAALRSGERFEVLELDPGDPERVRQVAASQPETAVGRWAREIGVESVIDNLRYAVLAGDSEMGIVSPEVQRAVVELGPEAGLSALKTLATMGRRLAHGSLNLERRRDRREGAGLAIRMSRSQADMAMKRLTKEALNAQGNGDRDTAKAKFAERERIAKAAFGDVPVIGRAGRTL